MKTDQITQSRLMEVLKYQEDGTPTTGWFTWKVANSRRVKVGAFAGSLRDDGYRTIRIDNTAYLEHRLVFIYLFGHCPPLLDHVDGNRLNNTPSNLRLASFTDNVHNQRVSKRSTSGFKGVNFHTMSGLWRSRVKTSEAEICYYSKCRFDAATIYNFIIAQHRNKFGVYNTVPQPWLETS